MDHATEYLPMETYNRIIKKRDYIYLSDSVALLLQLTVLFARIGLVNLFLYCFFNGNYN